MVVMDVGVNPSISLHTQMLGEMERRMWRVEGGDGEREREKHTETQREKIKGRDK